MNAVARIGEFYAVYAKGQHGYPHQGAVAYRRLTYEGTCTRCGIHGPQVQPFVVRAPLRAAHSHFLQLNGAFDAFFALVAVVEAIHSSGLTGVTFGPIVRAKDAKPFEERQQLHFTTVVPCLEVSRLPTVTCRENNEESHVQRNVGVRTGATDRTSCRRVKYHPPTEIGLVESHLSGAPDVFQTEEWVGSGARAYRLTIASRRFVALAVANGWRGLRFEPAVVGGRSRRVA